MAKSAAIMLVGDAIGETAVAVMVVAAMLVAVITVAAVVVMEEEVEEVVVMEEVVVTEARMQPSCITPPTGHSRELMCRGVAPNTMLASCVACAGLFSSWCVANSEQVYCTSGAL